jgi:O-antigen ligase
MRSSTISPWRRGDASVRADAGVAPLRETPLAARRWPPVLLAGLVGGALGALAAALTAAGPTPVLLVALLVLVGPLAVAIAGDVRRVLLGLALLDIPLQWDRYFGYRDDIDALAALAGWGVSLTTFAVAGLYATWIAQLLVSPGTAPRPRLAPAALPAAFLALLIASVAVAQDRVVAGFQITMYTQVLLLFVYIASTLRIRSDVRFIIVMLLAGLALESLITLVMFTTGRGFDVAGIATHTTTAAEGGPSRVGGTIGSPNNAGAYFAFMCALAGSVFLSQVDARLRRLALVGCVLGLAALVLTLSRGAWIAGLVSFLVLLLSYRRRRFAAPALAGLSLVLLLVLIPLQGTISSRLVHSDEGSAAGRVPLIEMAGEMIQDHPLLGVGANNYVVALPHYAGGRFAEAWLSSVHNKYLLIWSEAGPGALIAFLLFVGTTIVRGWRLRDAPDPLVAAAGVGIAAAVAGHAVHMNFDLFAGGTTTAMLWVAAAIVTSPAFSIATRRVRAPARASAAARRWPPPPGAASADSRAAGLRR